MRRELLYIFYNHLNYRTGICLFILNVVAAKLYSFPGGEGWGVIAGRNSWFSLRPPQKTAHSRKKNTRKGCIHWSAAGNMVALTNQWTMMYTVFAFLHPFKTKFLPFHTPFETKFATFHTPKNCTSAVEMKCVPTTAATTKTPSMPLIWQRQKRRKSSASASSLLSSERRLYLRHKK